MFLETKFACGWPCLCGFTFFSVPPCLRVSVVIFLFSSSSLCLPLYSALQFLKFFSVSDEFWTAAYQFFHSVTSVLLSVLCGQLLLFGLILDFLIFPLFTPSLCVEGFCLWLRLCALCVLCG